MKQLKWILPLAFLSLFLSGCIIDLDDDDNGRCINPDGPIVSEEVSLSRIEGINLSLPATVYVTQGEEQKVEIEAQDEIIDLIDKSVRGGIWDIAIDGCIRDAAKVTIYITSPEWTSLKISGEGNIISTNQLVVDDIDIDITGSGDIDVAIDADDIHSMITGSGDISLDGKADELDMTIKGSGDYKCFTLESRKASIDISGSGDAELFVTESLDVRISGSGDIFYKGSPNLSISISGSGDIVDSN